jgi:hypothetical protein
VRAGAVRDVSDRIDDPHGDDRRVPERAAAFGIVEDHGKAPRPRAVPRDEGAISTVWLRMPPANVTRARRQDVVIHAGHGVVARQRPYPKRTSTGPSWNRPTEIVVADVEIGSVTRAEEGSTARIR